MDCLEQIKKLLAWLRRMLSHKLQVEDVRTIDWLLRVAIEEMKSKSLSCKE